MKNYLIKWTYLRFIQLLVGLFFIWNFIEDGGKLSILFGVLMFLQATFNWGCFSSKGCDTTNIPKENIKEFAKKLKNIN